MKLSHAASPTPPAQAEQPALCGVGSSALLGCGWIYVILTLVTVVGSCVAIYYSLRVCHWNDEIQKRLATRSMQTQESRQSQSLQQQCQFWSNAAFDCALQLRALSEAHVIRWSPPSWCRSSLT